MRQSKNIITILRSSHFFQKPKRLSFYVTLFMIILLNISSQNVRFEKGKDQRGQTEKNVAGILHLAKSKKDGRLLANVFSTDVLKQFESLGLKSTAQVGKLFSLVWQDIFKRVPGQFGNLHFAAENSVSIQFATHVLVVDLNTVSLLYREQLKTTGLANLPTVVLDQIRGYGMIQENGIWKLDGLYDLSGRKYFLKDKEDEWGLARKFAAEAAKP